jgi:hypothetical protein
MIRDIVVPERIKREVKEFVIQLDRQIDDCVLDGQVADNSIDKVRLTARQEALSELREDFFHMVRGWDLTLP